MITSASAGSGPWPRAQARLSHVDRVLVFLGRFGAASGGGREVRQIADALVAVPPHGRPLAFDVGPGADAPRKRMGPAAAS